MAMASLKLLCACAAATLIVALNGPVLAENVATEPEVASADDEPLVWTDEGQCIVRRVADDFATAGENTIRGWDQSATKEELIEAYACILPRLQERYQTAELPIASLYQQYGKVGDAPVLSADFNDHYVTLYLNSVAAVHSSECADPGSPNGAVRVHDSFRIRPNGVVVRGPLFVMIKVEEASADNNNGWVTRTVLPSGKMREVARENWPVGFVSGCPDKEPAEVIAVPETTSETTQTRVSKKREVPDFDHEFESEL